MTPPDSAPFHAVAFGPHPDDAELFCGGTLARMVRLGYRAAIVDLTEGELSSRGTREIRRAEAEAAAKALGVQHRTNLGLPDGNLENSLANRQAVIRSIRELKPRLILLPHTEDRHPDHEQAAALIRAAAFQAGLARVDTGQPPHRAEMLLHYMCHHPFNPSLVVDVSRDQEKKERAIACYRSQFATKVLDGTSADGHPDTDGPQTPVSTQQFMEQLLARSTWFGSLVGARHGEPFLTRRPPRVDDPMGLLPLPEGPDEEGQ